MQKPVKKAHYTGSDDTKRLNDYVVDLDRDMFNFYTYLVNFPKVYIQASVPSIISDTIALWHDTTSGNFYWIANIGGTQKTLDYAASSSGTTNHSLLTALDYASAGHTGFQPSITSGNLSAVSPLSVTGGTKVVLGSGSTVSIAQATTSASGYVSNTDWGAFNNKADYVFGANNFTGTGNLVTTGTVSANALLGNTVNSITLTGTNISGNIVTATTANVGSLYFTSIITGSTVYASNITGVVSVYSNSGDFAYLSTIDFRTDSRSITGNYTIPAPGGCLFVFTVPSTCNLPSADIYGKHLWIKNATTGNLTLSPNGSDLIDGATLNVLGSYEAAHICDYGTGNWAII